MVKVTVNGRPICAEDGENLARLLQRNGFAVYHPCAGRGVCGKCKALVNGEWVLSCKYEITEDAFVEVNTDSDIKSECGIKVMLDGTKGSELALDIGSTTVALAEISPETGSACSILTFPNVQRAFGSDVISRIEYAMKNGVSDMVSPIRKSVSEKVSSLASEHGDGFVFDTMHVAGNTTMLHIFLGKDPSGMGTAPYTPLFLDERYLSAEEYGIEHVKTLHILPSISAFVGADLVAGLNHVGVDEERYSILLDLGTNAEVILFSRDRIVATAAAAGPCFEGADISCGMSAVAGAVYAYGEDGAKTIENAAPEGVCGTGLVDVVAYLLRHGFIDDGGFMEDDFEIAEGVCLTDRDVRQYQLAKSAVYSAIVTLMKRANVGFSDISHLYVSGGFSAELNVDNAAYTGLLPKELKDRFVYLGNSSLAGTIKAAHEKSDLSRITSVAQYVDLSLDSYFGEQFIENMGF